MFEEYISQLEKIKTMAEDETLSSCLWEHKTIAACEWAIEALSFYAQHNGIADEIEELRKNVDQLYSDQKFIKMLEEKGKIDVDATLERVNGWLEADEKGRLVVLSVAQSRDAKECESMEERGEQKECGDCRCYCCVAQMPSVACAEAEAALALQKEDNDVL